MNKSRSAAEHPRPRSDARESVTITLTDLDGRELPNRIKALLKVALRRCSLRCTQIVYDNGECLSVFPQQAADATRSMPQTPSEPPAVGKRASVAGIAKDIARSGIFDASQIEIETMKREAGDSSRGIARRNHNHNHGSTARTELR